MKTRLGKIAQLPKSIRDDLNHRIENGKQGTELLEWLNGLPETKEIIAQKFDNQPITRCNLSDWRHGGFLDWRADQNREARIQRISESGESLQKAEAGDLFENFARITVAEMMDDLDALQKCRGQKRAQNLHNLVRDLARLQNAYNRSRWAALAWTKYNDTLPTEPETKNPKPETVSELDLSAIASATAETPNAKLVTPLTTTALVPDCAESKTVPPDDSEPKPDGNGMYVIHFTNCDCDEPCPKCHAPDSNYPLEEAIRDRQYYRKYGRFPCDRRGKARALINVACDCSCDRCDINTPPAFPHDPMPRHEPKPSDENPSAIAAPQPQIQPLNAHTDFLRRMALLKTATLANPPRT
jgi:hypothetical protein